MKTGEMDYINMKKKRQVFHNKYIEHPNEEYTSTYHLFKKISSLSLFTDIIKNKNNKKLKQPLLHP